MTRVDIQRRRISGVVIVDDYQLVPISGFSDARKFSKCITWLLAWLVAFPKR